MDLVLRLRELRRLSGLSQEEVAHRSGVGAKTLSSFETGVRIESLKVSQLRKILHVYGVTETDFFGSDLETTLANDADMKPIPGAEKLKSLPIHVRHALIERFELMIDTALVTLGHQPLAIRPVLGPEARSRPFAP
jgi:transcriptional regulator with XRE-family HTH domain